VNDFVEFLPVIAQASGGGAIRENPVVCGIDISKTVLQSASRRRSWLFLTTRPKLTRNNLARDTND
jgi:hypothetical protein